MVTEIMRLLEYWLLNPDISEKKEKHTESTD